jgi:hypothetical protein
MSLLTAFPCYSVDTSAMAWLDNEYPQDIFGGVWRLLGRLADEGRLLMCEQAVAECEDPAVTDFLVGHSQVVLRFAAMEGYILRLQEEDYRHHINLTDHEATEQDADPFVVALALMIEQRDLADLRVRTRHDAMCSVVCYETRKGKQWRRGEARPKIPDVCDFYGLSCVRWPDVLRAEGFRQ